MKKILIAALLVLGSLGVFAQAGTQYFAILPGYQFSTGNYQYSQNFIFNNHVYQFRVNGSGENNFVGSLDYGYFFTENVGIHAAYVYNAGSFQANIHVGPYYFGNYKFDKSINWVEVGPEFVGMVGQNGQIYGQINLGYTFGNSTPNLHTAYGSYPLGDFGSQTFIYGGAFGYRYYFNNSVGIAVQATYHHMQDYPISDLWDARVGVTFKF
jgi:hypothetical protein